MIKKRDSDIFFVIQFEQIYQREIRIPMTPARSVSPDRRNTMTEEKRQHNFRSQTGSGKKGLLEKGIIGRELPIQRMIHPQKSGPSRASDERQLNKLKRQELLEILVDQSREIDRLRAELREAQERLADREVKVKEAGTLAEASLQIYNIFETAQNAANLYLENIKRRAGVGPDDPSETANSPEETPDPDSQDGSLPADGMETPPQASEAASEVTEAEEEDTESPDNPQPAGDITNPSVDEDASSAQEAADTEQDKKDQR